MHQAPTKAVGFMVGDVIPDQFWPGKKFCSMSDFLPYRSQRELTIRGVSPTKGVTDNWVGGEGDGTDEYLEAKNQE